MRCSLQWGGGRTSVPSAPDAIPRSATISEVGVVDTIRWAIVAEEEFPPIMERNSRPETRREARYRVAVLAPIGSRGYLSQDRLPPRTIRALEFVAGLQYGATQYVQGVELDIYVVDAEKVGSRFEDILRHPQVEQADIVLAPYMTDQVVVTAATIASMDKVVVSPWNTNPLPEPNPHYVQLRPSLKTHAEKITDFLLKSHRPQNVVLIARDRPQDREALQYYQQRCQAMLSDTTAAFVEYMVTDISDNSVTEYLAQMIEVQEIAAFVVPVWQDAAFVLATLAKLNVAKGDKTITVYGLPQWLDMPQIDYDYLENLQVHITNNRPFTFDGAEATALRRHYYDTYGELAGPDAYYGADVIRWLGHVLHREGTLITNNLAGPTGGWHRFSFRAQLMPGSEKVHFYENEALQIYRFGDYALRRVD